MRFNYLVVVLLVCSISIQTQGQRPYFSKSAAKKVVANSNANETQTLPIKRVILYSNGVAYIERRGTVTGRAEINLSFKQSQVDDVLKSMVVLDLGQGRIGAVSYNSSAPPSSRMADIPFSIGSQTNGNGGIAGVLSQLQGAKVSVATIKGVIIGSVLTVEKQMIQQEKDKPAVPSHSLVIASESGELSTFDLSEVRSIKLLEEGTKRDINEFANATASARRRDAKTITVTSDGNASREMVISYTIAAPIWKTTYRVVLDEQGKPFFQGWAIVDNVSEENWDNVSLSLVSGTPISFIQQIQQPFYRYRPVVPMPSDLQLNPQTYDPNEEYGEGSGSGSGSGQGDGTGGGVSVSGSRSRSNNVTVDGVASNEIVSRQMQQLPTSSRNIQDNFIRSSEPTTSVSDAITSSKSGVDTAATGDEIGDLFEYKVNQPVTVKRDRSALIPIVQTKMEGERISIYNQSVRADRPLSGLLLKNTTTLTLEGGSLTVLDRDAYAGEALMERLKPAEQRLISFALDLGTLVTAKQEASNAPVFLVRAVNGVFQTHYHQTDKRVYSIRNQTDKERVVFIEHLVRDGWELSDDTMKPFFTTSRYYRFRVVLKPFDKVELPVIERRALMNSYALSDISRTQLDLFVSQRYIDDETRKVLEKITDLKSRINAIDQKIAALENEEESISTDQARLRENIKALTSTPEAKQLIARYVSKANEQETRIEQISQERKTANNDREKLYGELSTLIKGIDVTKRL